MTADTAVAALLAALSDLDQLAQRPSPDEALPPPEPRNPPQVAAAPETQPSGATGGDAPPPVPDLGSAFGNPIFVTAPMLMSSEPPSFSLPNPSFGGFGSVPTFISTHAQLVTSGNYASPIGLRVSASAPIPPAIATHVPQDHSLPHIASLPHVAALTPMPAVPPPVAAAAPVAGASTTVAAASGSTSAGSSLLLAASGGSDVLVGVQVASVTRTFSDSFFVGPGGYTLSTPTDYKPGGVFGPFNGLVQVVGQSASAFSAAVTFFSSSEGQILDVLRPSPRTVTLGGPAGLVVGGTTSLFAPPDGGPVTLAPTSISTAGDLVQASIGSIPSPPPPPLPPPTPPTPPVPQRFVGTLGQDAFVGGAGNDVFSFDAVANSLQSGDRIIGGSGTDVIVATFAGATTLGATLVVDQVESVLLTGAPGTAMALDAAGVHGTPNGSFATPSEIVAFGSFSLKVTNLAVNLDASFDTMSIDVTASGDQIAILGGAGNDTITAAPGSSHTTILGGAGDNVLSGAPGDTLAYSLAPHGATIDFSIGRALDNGYGGTDTISGFDHVIGSKTGVNTVTMAPGMTLHVANVQVVHGDSVHGGDALIIERATPGGVTVDHVSSITGSALNDRITVVDSTPVTINGGGGFDTLIAGPGEDTFQISSLFSGGASIEHFDTTHDRIELGSAAAFPGLGAGGGAIDPARFIHDTGTFTGNYSATVTHGMNAAFDAGQPVIVQDAGGYLYYAVHAAAGYSVATLGHVDATLTAANIHLHP